MTAEKIKASVEQIYASAGLTIPDEKLQERLKTVIAARLRDVRDALETLEMLVQPKELGGLSLSQDDARRVLKLVDDSLHAVHAEHQQKMAADKAKWLEAVAEKKRLAESSALTNDAKELDTLYKDIVAKSPKAQAVAAAAVPSQPLAMGAPLTAPTIKPPLATPPTPLASTHAPANLPLVPEPAGATVKTQTPTPTPAPPPPPPPVVMPKPVTLVRPAPQIAASPSVRPIMQDVKPMGGGAGVRLTGPAEELRTTAIIDFRRLSKDPAVAAQKIKDKIDLLHQQSYEKRTEGISAWMDSEVHRTYLAMMKDAFEGKPLPQAVSERQAAKQPFLTAEEFRAVAGLSQKLRY